MATDKYPQRNHNVPMPQSAVQAARQRAAAKTPAPRSFDIPVHGTGSRREIGPGEWVDDRMIDWFGPALPSLDTPPEITQQDQREVPASYDPTKVYEVALGKGMVFAGRMLSPGKQYVMVGSACTEISAAIINAVEIGDVPVYPDAPPSSDNQSAETPNKQRAERSWR